MLFARNYRFDPIQEWEVVMASLIPAGVSTIVTALKSTHPDGDFWGNVITGGLAGLFTTILLLVGASPDGN